MEKSTSFVFGGALDVLGGPTRQIFSPCGVSFAKKANFDFLHATLSFQRMTNVYFFGFLATAITIATVMDSLSLSNNVDYFET